MKKNEIINICAILSEGEKKKKTAQKRKKKWLKIEQYELPEEAAGLSVVLTVRYIWEEFIKQGILLTKAFPHLKENYKLHIFKLN